MTLILGLSGSLRSDSFNTSLLRAAVDLVPAGVTLEAETIAGVPLYDGDLEAREGLPARVRHLQARLAAADGLLLVTPEYNNGIPGVFKNAIDWMSRGEGLGLFAGKPVAVIGASPGPFGTILSQNHWLPVLKALGTELWSGGRLMVSRVNTLVDGEGELTDAATLDMLATFVAGFAAFVERRNA